jgi:hypothetical protein
MRISTIGYFSEVLQLFTNECWCLNTYLKNALIYNNNNKLTYK